MSIGPCPDDLPGAAVVAPGTWVSPTRALMHLTGGWRVLVEDGTRITVDGPPDDPTLASGAVEGRTWIVDGWALPYAFLQQGLMPLHATTVDVGGQVVAIGGRSGAGKSTTALALAARGHALLTDDSTVVDLRDDGPWVLPFWRRVHLYPETADALGLAPVDAMTGQPAKGAVLPAAPPTQPRRLTAVVLLDPHPDAAAVTGRRERGAQALSQVLTHAGRQQSGPITLGAARYLAIMTRLAGGTPVWSVERPDGPWTAEAVADLVEEIAADPRSAA